MAVTHRVPQTQDRNATGMLVGPGDSHPAPGGLREGRETLLEGEVELFIMGQEQKPESELKLGMCGW